MENPDSWNDDIKAIAASMRAHHALEQQGTIGESVMSRIDREVVAPIRSQLEYVLNILKLTDENDCKSCLMWRVKGNNPDFAINCSDVFMWGCADAENITPETLPILEQAFRDAEDEGPFLYCARIRKMRPQGATYEYIDQKYWPLFDACGPVREVDFGNPHKHPSEK